MGIDRQTIRRVLLTQLVELSGWPGKDLIESVRAADLVRQIHVSRDPDIALNLRVEIASDQSGCPEGGTRLWINVNDFEAIESAELLVVGNLVFIGDTIKSLGR